MLLPITLRVRAAAAVAVLGALSLTACSAGSLGTSGGSASGGAASNVTITLLTDNSDQTAKPAQAVVDAFNATNSGVTVKLDTRAQGTDGDNVVKTKLATGDMADVFQYNSGSLMAALDPAKNMVPLTSESLLSNVQDSFKTAVTSGGEVYGVPFGQATGGGILYNKKVFADLGLQVPKTWAEFMANNAKIKAAGIDPVIQTYGDTWTSQLPDGSPEFEVGSGSYGWTVADAAEVPSFEHLSPTTSLAAIMDDREAYETVKAALARFDPAVAKDFTRRMAWVPNQPLFGTFSLISPVIIAAVEADLDALNARRGV